MPGPYTDLDLVRGAEPVKLLCMPRRFQFSLRALLVAVVIMAVPFSRLASTLDERRKEREFVRAIERRGVVVYDWQQEIMGRKYKGKTPESRGWVDDFFGRV